VALSRRAQRVLIAGLCCAALGVPSAAGAVTLSWKGHTWQVTSGGMAGVCQGDPNNVTVDAAGYLHLKISRNNNTWSAAELFTTDRLGFGTYQWQVDGPIDTFDKNVVLGLFPYGPAAGIGADGTNEIDIEYSRWGQANGPNGDWTNYPASGSTIGEMSYTFSLGGATLSTSRFTWTTTSITDFLFAGLQPIDGTAGVIKTWTYAPSNPTVNIPQQALPLGMNLWCFSAPPSDGNPVEIVIRDFSFAAAGAGGTGGASGSGGTGGASGAGGRGGTSGGGGTGGMSGAGGRGGMSGAGGSGGTGGAGTGGTSGTSGGGGRGGARGGEAIRHFRQFGVERHPPHRAGERLDRINRPRLAGSFQQRRGHRIDIKLDDRLAEPDVVAVVQNVVVDLLAVDDGAVFAMQIGKRPTFGRRVDSAM